MKRGFAYSLAALALALAVAQAAIIFSQSQYGTLFGRDSQKDAVDFAAFSEANAMQSGLLSSCSLAAAAAKGYEEDTNLSFANKSCVLSFLARNGNVTPANCPGEGFALIETTNKSYALSSIARASASRGTGTIGVTDGLLTIYASDNGTHTTCAATASITVATPDNTTMVTRTYSAASTVED